MLTDTAALDTEAEELQRELEIVAELIHHSVDENAHIGLNQAKYQQRYNGLVERYEKAKARLEKIEELQQARRAKREQLDSFLATLLQQDSVLTEFDESLWFAVIDKVVVHSADDIQFTFRDGTVIKA
ncbi:MAG: hypothetical protein A4E53_02559 [Pelotomaculum sp. PtaB.Bin104]|nr:MAG: hypothetical protein A4E53_02559 [Pelotomaculum sp. PtaB.Bin104]